MSRHYNTLYCYALGMTQHVVTTLGRAKHLATPDPIDPPDVDPPDPAPQPTPDPAPNPEPIPLPPNDPPDPPDPDPAEYDDVIFPGALVLSPVKHAKAHDGKWWWQVDEQTLRVWNPTSARHLLEILGKLVNDHRACVVFTVELESEWRGMILELAPRGLLILEA